MKYRVQHTTKYSYTDAVPLCHNLVHLAPRTLSNQTCHRFELSISPTPREQSCRTDVFGNRVDYFLIRVPHLSLDLTTISELDVWPRSTSESDIAWEVIVKAVRCNRTDAYLEALQYVFPSKCVPTNDVLAEYASVSFQPERTLIGAATELTNRIHREFVFRPRATTVNTPVMEVFFRVSK